MRSKAMPKGGVIVIAKLTRLANVCLDFSFVWPSSESLPCPNSVFMTRGHLKRLTGVRSSKVIQSWA